MEEVRVTMGGCSRPPHTASVCANEEGVARGRLLLCLPLHGACSVGVEFFEKGVLPPDPFVLRVWHYGYRGTAMEQLVVLDERK